MGDYYYISSANEDLWLQEDCYTTRSSENQALDYFCPNIEQGISALLEEITSTENSELAKHNNTQVPNSIDHVQESSDAVVSGLLDDVSNVPKSLFVEVQETSPLFDKKDYSVIATSGRDSVNAFTGKVKIRGQKRPLTEDEEPEEEEGGEDSVMKKKGHNAKERMRRLKLHQTYLALGSLLPISTTSKKRWTAPVIIDKALDYIPELETEIQGLVHKKSNVLSAIEKEKLMIITKNNKLMDSKASEALTVSVNEVRQGELIFQICMKSNVHDDDNATLGIFSNLIQNFEDQGIKIMSASTLCICDERECYTIHIQMNETLSSTDTHGRDYIARLKEKIISLLS